MKYQRTHRTKDVTVVLEGKEVVLCGFIDSLRDHGDIQFVDLRDRSGKVQVVFRSAAFDPGLRESLRALKPELPLWVRGVVRLRPPEAVNPHLPTGTLEIEVLDFELLNVLKETFPFEVNALERPHQELRLNYRYLDLRSERLQGNLILRHQVNQGIRDFLTRKDFIEVETPILVKWTPGGARNFIVPSRLYPGHGYALAESPQLFKQLLMMAGLERYFQIARCFRDEDLRSDRQPEFTQLDLEMSFCEENDILSLIEELMVFVLERLDRPVPDRPFPRLTYDEARRRFGSDKPDLRWGLEIQDLQDVFQNTGIRFLKEVLSHQDGAILGLFVDKEDFTRKEISDLERRVKERGGKGLFCLVLSDRDPKLLSVQEREALLKLKGSGGRGTVLMVADQREKAEDILGELRLHLARLLNLVPEDRKNVLKFCWVVDFPLFERSGETGQIVAKHHPFTSPQGDVEGQDPLKLKARAYDLVVNGMELGGGSIRIHRTDVQYRIFEILGFEESLIRDKFGFLLKALDSGAPPHGGIALGLDRWVALLAHEKSIQEVIAFPKTSTMQDLMTGAPSPLPETLLHELHLRSK